MPMKPEQRMRLRRLAVVLCRLTVGAAFALAGWAKSVDPWGFVYKMGEYLNVWGLTEIPHELVVAAAIALSCVEFLAGILILTGCLRRSSTLLAAAMMLFMLPLTTWIYADDPVSDCGCFGDFVTLSNGATLLKNIVLALMTAYLLRHNRSVRGLFAMPVQWMVVAVSLAFPLYLAVMGYNVQPLVDFRPYPVGSSLTEDTDEDTDNTLYIYERDGHRENFTLDALPDSTWTFVDAVSSGDAADSTPAGIDVLDDDGNNILPELIDSDGPQLILTVSDPELHFLTRSHYVNSLYEYLSADGVGMIGLAGASGEAFDRWKRLTRPHFAVYPAEDTSLKELARGEAAVVYLREGRIVWKRSLQSLDARLPYSAEKATDALDSLDAVDSGFIHSMAAGIYALSVALIYLLSLSPKILNLFKKLFKFI